MCVWLALLLIQAPPSGPAEHGYALAQRGDLKGAETELRAAVKLAPNDAVPLALLGMVLMQENRLDEAARFLERAAQIDPADTGTRYNLAVNQFRQGKLADAKANLERILNDKPGHAQAGSLLAEVRGEIAYESALEQFKAGRFAESQAALERLTGAGTRDPKVFSLLGLCQQRQNRPNEALAAMRRAIELAPGDATWYANAAQILLENRVLQAAYGTAAKALELAPAFVPALKVKGTVEMERGAYKKAVETFRRTVELAPSDPDALRSFGTAQAMLSQYSEAAATFEKGIARFPRYAPLYEAYGKLLLSDTASEARGVALLNKALALDANLSEAHYELGKLSLARGDETVAVRHLEAAVRLSPADSRAHLALANAYRAAGRAEDSAKELKLYRETKTGEEK